MMTDKNVWYLPGPFHRYEDDVKAIAKKNGLIIIDANVTDDRDGETENPPEVTLKELPKVVLVIGQGDSLPDLDKLRAELDSIGVLVAGLEAGDLHTPESGDLALRLFDVMSCIHASMVELAISRDALSGEAEKLREEILSLKADDELRAAEGGEIEGLKAKLEAANVTYRSNASKESLEKLVAELPKE